MLELESEYSTTDELESDDSAPENTGLESGINESEDVNCNHSRIITDGPVNLFSGSKISAQHFNVALLSIMLKHNMTYSCVLDQLKLLSCSLPSPNAVPPTLFKLMNKFVQYNKCIEIHTCCSYCTRSLSVSEGSSCEQAECISAGSLKSTFIEVSLEKQLQILFFR